jgi:tripartite-type tricarboxylate transporter receptor subunit TctC
MLDEWERAASTKAPRKDTAFEETTSMAQRFALWAALCAGIGLQPAAYAAIQEFPTRPVRIVVPSRPIGSKDAVAQLLSKQLAEAWHAKVVIDHRPGPGGKVGAETVARAAPDGHTVLLAGTSLATTPALYRELRYDVTRDLVSIAGVAISPFLIVTQPTLPARSVSDLIALATKLGKLPLGCPGPGSEEHLCGELLGQLAVIGITTRHYESRDATLFGLLKGDVPIAFSEVPRAAPHVKSGQVRAIAITSHARSPMLPEVPSVSETLPGYECTTWLALFAPAKTPAHVRSRIAATASKVTRNGEMRARLRAEGLYAYAGSAEDFARFFRAEVAKWEKVARVSGITLD